MPDTRTPPRDRHGVTTGLHPMLAAAMKPRIGSLCSGAGGLDLAVEEVFGAETVWHVERDAAASKVLAARWPGVRNHGDIQATDWATVEPIDIMAAGYPCQPDSLAGKGLSEGDDRWIWPDIAAAIGVLRPGLIVLENVPGHFVRGFRTVLGSLTVLGYDARWTLVRAADVGAPHRRERLFVVAADSDGERQVRRWAARRRWARSAGSGVPAADADQSRLEGRDVERGGRPSERATRSDGLVDSVTPDPRGARLGEHPGGPPPQETRPGSGHIATGDSGSRAATDWGPYRPAIERWEHALGRLAPAPTETGPNGGQRLAARFVEWMQGYDDGWVCDVPGISRNDQLKILGNSVVRQQGAFALRRLVAVRGSQDAA